MKVTLRFDKTVQENATVFFERAKKAKKKLDGLSKAMVKMDGKIKSAALNEEHAKKISIEKKRDKKWFEKFHWFYSSDGFLVIAGRDAKSNEFLMKKHFEKGDRYFHADIHGAAHTVVKTEGQKASEQTLKEAAQFAAVFSKAWGAKYSGVDVYSAEFGQVTKQAPSGESIGTGAFMIYGKREWFRKTPLEFAIGATKDGAIVSGPVFAVKKQTDNFVEITPGEERKSEFAKKTKGFFEHKTKAKISLDEITQMLPSGDVKTRKKPPVLPQLV